MAVIEPGTVAPDFKLRDQNRHDHALSDYRGRPVVLLFYPMDFSTVCTEEMRCMVDNIARFDQLDAQVFGLSVDHIHAHRVFAQQRAIGYPLLADFHPKGAVSSAYGLYRDDLGFSSRGWAVIAPDGTVAAAKDVGIPNLPDLDEIAQAVETAKGQG